MQSKKYLSVPVEPFQVDEKASVREILERMGNISFQGRNLSLAFSIWKSMLQDETTILLGLAVAAGWSLLMGKILALLVMMVLLNPSASHALARAAIHGLRKPWLERESD